MNWKDTVMERKERVKAAQYDSMSDDLPDWAIRALKAQAEISFKVGKTAGVAESLIPSLKAIEASRKAGIVGWIEGNSDLEKCDPETVMAEWQVQKKEWGINEKT